MRITLSGDNLNNVEGQSYSILSLHWRQEDNTKRNSVPQVTTNKKDRSSHAGQRSAGQPYWTGSHISGMVVCCGLCKQTLYQCKYSLQESLYIRGTTCSNMISVSTAPKEHHSTKCKSVIKS